MRAMWPLQLQPKLTSEGRSGSPGMQSRRKQSRESHDENTSLPAIAGAKLPFHVDLVSFKGVISTKSQSKFRTNRKPKLKLHTARKYLKSVSRTLLIFLGK
ncbi:unnamed protein product [Lasius platythorax]|uniref:Uncharacterized protein n=1 Tax=Lasius platythorax TaxID=488582 RepID=A0AAV2NUQ9_9HYME